MLPPPATGDPELPLVPLTSVGAGFAGLIVYAEGSNDAAVDDGVMYGIG